MVGKERMDMYKWWIGGGADNTGLGKLYWKYMNNSSRCSFWESFSSGDESYSLQSSKQESRQLHNLQQSCSVIFLVLLPGSSHFVFNCRLSSFHVSMDTTWRTWWTFHSICSCYCWKDPRCHPGSRIVLRTRATQCIDDLRSIVRPVRGLGV